MNAIAVKGAPSLLRAESNTEPWFFDQVSPQGEASGALQAITNRLRDAAVHFHTPVSRASIEHQFQELAATWRAETRHDSSITDIVMHTAYQRIIGLGMPVVPFILRELRCEPDHWFWALKAITGEDPVRPEHRGRLAEMARAWIEWDRRRG